MYMACKKLFSCICLFLSLLLNVPAPCRVYFRDRCVKTIACNATVGQKLQIKLAVTPVADTEPYHLQRGQDVSPLSVQLRLEERKRWIPGTPWPNLKTGVGPADHFLLPGHRALWSECPSEEDWHFRHLPGWVWTSWPNPRPHPSVLPRICWETSVNMAARCWSGDKAVGLSRRPPLDGWFCGINRTEDLTSTAVDCWRIRRRRSCHTSHNLLMLRWPILAVTLQCQAVDR